jgi:chemotaxis protein MotB
VSTPSIAFPFCARAPFGRPERPQRHQEDIAVFTRISFISLAIMILSGCGYSEEEWQAQLAKYGQLNDQHQKEQAAHSETRAALDKEMQRVADLSRQMQEMGINMDSLNEQLQQTGTEKQQLAASLSEVKLALEEYKRRAAQLERIKERFERLRQKLQKLVNLGLKVEIRRNRMVIRLPGDVLFASGQAKLQKGGKDVLGQVAEVVRNDKQLAERYFQIAGHTDNKPLTGGRFGDNWGLSAMRAREVLLYLIAPVDDKDGGGGLDANKLHAAGYGETDPVERNESDEGRQANRRVELVLLPNVEEMLDLKNML